MILAVLLTLPWVGLLLLLIFRREPLPSLPEDVSDVLGEGPAQPALVSVIVPARNEARNIERVVSSLTASEYPAFEVLVVDDRSDDDTAERVRKMDAGNARRLEVVDGEPLPEGWVGKCWACWQGRLEARGELLLFTDADTVHDPDLLGRTVAELERCDADVLTLLGEQRMESFWENLVQPQIFLPLAFLSMHMREPFRPDGWRRAFANGQFIFVRAEVYDEVGGHERIRGAVVDDQRFAQLVVRNGRRLILRRAWGSFAIRMYHNLGEIVRGWSKNLVMAGMSSVRPRARPFTPFVMGAVPATLWILPPLVLAGGLAWTALDGPAASGTGLAGILTGWLALPGDPRVMVWSGTVVAVSLLLWSTVHRGLNAPRYYAFFYPLGAAVRVYIVLRGWLGIRSIEWKGRRYESEASEMDGAREAFGSEALGQDEPR